MLEILILFLMLEEATNLAVDPAPIVSTKPSNTFAVF
jgi:hypothetical protein